MTNHNIHRGYHDFDIEIEGVLLQNGMLQDLFYLKDLQQRKLIINMDIDQPSVADAVRQILQYNAEDRDIPIAERKPIKLYLVSCGGEVDSGFELIDAIEASKTPVYTINMGYQYSMGFLIGLSGHKRYAFRNAKYLMHDGSNFIVGSAAKVKDQAEFNLEVEARIRNYILNHSKLTEAEYDSKYRVEWYMFAQEAKEKGFVDHIIGEDCDIDDVV